MSSFKNQFLLQTFFFLIFETVFPINANFRIHKTTLTNEHYSDNNFSFVENILFFKFVARVLRKQLFFFFIFLFIFLCSPEEENVGHLELFKILSQLKIERNKKQGWNEERNSFEGFCFLMQIDCPSLSPAGLIVSEDALTS